MNLKMQFNNMKHIDNTLIKKILDGLIIKL
jgi:hypothetical protein